MSIAYKKNGVFVTASGTPPIDDALSATSENPVQNKIVKQAVDGVDSKVSKTEDLIAYVQTSLTASKNYAVGEQFVYNGLLYKATATIAQGGTITINGNCALADSVTGQISAINTSLVNKLKTLNFGTVSFGSDVTTILNNLLTPINANLNIGESLMFSGEASGYDYFIGYASKYVNNILNIQVTLGINIYVYRYIPTVSAAIYKATMEQVSI